MKAVMKGIAIAMLSCILFGRLIRGQAGYSIEWMSKKASTSSLSSYCISAALLTIFDREPETAMKALHGAC